ncbi:MAG TPA: sigma 54-interacting transcriptional regulator [Gemmatirosa sp.]
MPSVLIVDDEPNIRRMVGALLAGEGYDVRDAPDGASGLAAARAAEPDVALVDLMMPGAVDGLGMLERLREQLPDLPVVMMSGRAALGDAVRATKLGAFTFLEKPLTPEGVLLALGSALELRRARQEARALREEIGLGGAMVGDSPAMAAVRALVARVGPTDARVLVTGESGTGKELVAAGLHGASARRERPFVRVNCAAIPRDLVESEMFGHERGAFTGATDRRIGRFELAHTGTLFLDEVGDLGAEAQAKLLRALEAGEIERVGGARPIRVDVRIVSATNKDLSRAVAEGAFREDLFFRLNVIPIHLPPLRERPGDVPLLVRHFSALYRARTGRPAPAWSDDALALMERHRWPGNVRELANVVERLAILQPGGEVRAADARRVLAADGDERSADVPPRDLGPLPDAAGLDVSLADALDAYERTLIVRALSAAGGNVTDAARRLRTDRPNLYRRMRRLAIPLACALAALAGGRRAAAQGVGTDARPRATAGADTIPDAASDGVADAVARYNAPATLRVRGRFVVPAGTTVEGDVAVVGGPVTVAGRVMGRLTVINGDVTFRAGARVDGDVLVVGGVVDGRREALFGGELRIDRHPATVAQRGDTLALDRDALGPDATDRRRARFRLGGAPSARTYAGFTVASGGAYNRAEGLPILVGPTLEAQVARDARLTVDLLGVYRTAGEFEWDTEHRGHDAHAELRLGRRRHLRIGGRLYDVVAPIEDWQLSPTETGLSSFFLRRDFRDWYGRHGAALSVGADLGPDASFTLGYADERWGNRAQLNPATILRGREEWRPNPSVDDGVMHLLTAGLRIDTRNDVDRPWAGWYVAADYEYGTGTLNSFAPVSADLVIPGGPPLPGARDETPGHRAYGRGFLDVRRYNRLTPDAQLNLRLVAGGWLHGDALPVERRLSVSGPGAIAGYSFRQAAGSNGFDVADCSVRGLQPAGDPAQCERIALGQVEYRTDVRVGLFTGEEGGERVRRGLRTEFSWVVFADAGRGWLVGPQAGSIQYGAGTLPGLGTALADLGAGLDFGHPHGSGDVGTFGVYVAKSVTTPDRPPTFFLRLRRRF